MYPQLHTAHSSKRYLQCTNTMQKYLNCLGTLQQLLHQKLFCQLFRGCENEHKLAEPLALYLGAIFA